ncbi:MAG: hypothetical protein JWL77_6827, partial [Chthonomonadaceae bacterium]|nr:hypothetical protein [Chthonomonadaceae bacterium]
RVKDIRHVAIWGQTRDGGMGMSSTDGLATAGTAVTFKEGRRLGILAGVVALALVVFGWAAPRAHANQSFAPLAGSTFQGADGDQVNTNPPAGQTVTDWQDYASLTGVLDSPFPSSTGSDTFYAGHEDTPDTWTLSSVSGGVTPGKDNALAVWGTRDTTPGIAKLFFYFSFLRASTSNANTFYGLELNKLTNTWKNSNNVDVPCRSDGDLMISYEIDPSNKNVNFKIYQWNGSGGPPECPDGRTGSFTDITSPTVLSNVQGYMNFNGSITNYLSPASVGNSIDTGKFGEGAVNLTDTLGGAGQDTCVDFGQAQLHSRSSASLSSALQDTVAPVPILLRSCTISGTKFHDLNANGVKDAGEPGLAGWRIYVDKNNNGQLDAGEPMATTAADGSYTIEKVPAGTYTVREAPPVGDSSTWYCSTPSPKGTLSTDCNQTGVTVSDGSNVTGVDFGNYQKAKLTVAKQTVPAGGGPFTFTSGDLGQANASFQLSDGGTKTVSVDPGDTPYQVAETTDPNYNLTSIGCTGDTVAPDSSGSGTTATFNLKSGEDVTCTFTNTRKTGQITVTKSLAPANDDGSFDLNVGDQVVASAVGDGGTGSTTVPTGTYSVGELAHTGSGTSLGDYLSSVTCTKNGQDYLGPQDGTSLGDIVVGENDQIDCVIHNVRKGSVAIHKVGVGGTGTFDFTTSDAGVTDVSNLATGDTSAPQTVAPGTYSFAEVAKSGWDLTDVTCDDGQSPTPSTTNVDGASATFKVDPGEHVVCTFTNTKRGSLAIHKVGVGGSGTFDFHTTDAGVSNVDGLATGDTSTPQEVKPGTYTFSELAQAGWDLTGVSCDDANSATPSTTNVDGASATFKVDPGEDVVCTFTNTKRGSVAIRKLTDGGSGTFDFTANDPGTTNVEGLASGTTSSPQSVAPGSYSFTEQAQAHWQLTGISCYDGGSATPSTTDGATATFKVDPGEDVVCTYTNAHEAKVVINKQTVPHDTSQDTTKFDFSSDLPVGGEQGGSFQLADGGTLTTYVDPGSDHFVAET